jgi:hypothetical protein
VITRRGGAQISLAIDQRCENQRCENIFLGRALNQSPDLVVVAKTDEPDAPGNDERVNLTNG